MHHPSLTWKSATRPSCLDPPIHVDLAFTLPLQLVCGTPHYDFRALEANTRYDGFCKTDQTIQWFWEVMPSSKLIPRVHFAPPLVVESTDFIWGIAAVEALT
eukprot:scaffold266382_cov30-Tisochrysis_lutea.AAC.3